jgi:hypothetical protein
VKSIHGKRRIPFRFTLSEHEHEQDNEMNNDNDNLTLSNGSPNLANPRVLAGFIDGVGILLAPFAAAIMMQDEVNDKMRTDFQVAFRTLQEMRNAVGVDTDWHMENQVDIVAAVVADGEMKMKKNKDALAGIVKNMLAMGMPLDMIPPHLRPRSTPAEVADSIFDQLRADGVIG